MLTFSAAALAAALACILLHYEALRLLAGWTLRMSRAPRQRLVAVMVGALVSQIVQIVFFACVLWMTVALAAPAALADVATPTTWRALYLSIESYAALGSPDTFHFGALRLFCGIESLLGLLMIGWTSAFTYWAMRKFWRFH